MFSFFLFLFLFFFLRQLGHMLLMTFYFLWHDNLVGTQLVPVVARYNVQDHASDTSV